MVSSFKLPLAQPNENDLHTMERNISLNKSKKSFIVNVFNTKLQRNKVVDDDDIDIDE